MTVIRWEKSASADREAVFMYLYREAGAQVAIATDERFDGMVNILKASPMAGVRAGKTEKQRKLIVPRFPFIIVYVYEDETVSILRILHTSRKIAGHYRRQSALPDRSES